MTKLITDTGVTTSPDTRAWLLQDEEWVRGRIATAVTARKDDSPAAARIARLAGTVLRDSVGAEILRRLRELLGDDLQELLVEGLAKHQALQTAARATLAEPGSESVVTLGAQRVRVEQDPSIDVLVDGKRAFSLDFNLDIVFTLVEVRATVRAGALMELSTPSPKVIGTLKSHGHEISRGEGELRLPLRVTFGVGYPLLPDQTLARHAATHPAGATPPEPRQPADVTHR